MKKIILLIVAPICMSTSLYAQTLQQSLRWFKDKINTVEHVKKDEKNYKSAGFSFYELYLVSSSNCSYSLSNKTITVTKFTKQQTTRKSTTGSKILGGLLAAAAGNKDYAGDKDDDDIKTWEETYEIYLKNIYSVRTVDDGLKISARNSEITVAKDTKLETGNTYWSITIIISNNDNLRERMLKSLLTMSKLSGGEIELEEPF